MVLREYPADPPPEGEGPRTRAGKAGTRGAVLLDLDGTLVTERLWDEFSHELTFTQFPGLVRYMRALLLLMVYIVLKVARLFGAPREKTTGSAWFAELWTYLILQGLTEKQLQQYASSCLPRYRAGTHNNVLQEVRGLQAKGYEVCVVTGNFAELVGPYVVGELGFQLIASELEVGEGGAFTGRCRRGGVNFGGRKVENVRRRYGDVTGHKVGYGNDYNDLFLLRSVDDAVAVRPDKVLATECARQGWRIIREP